MTMGAFQDAAREYAAAGIVPLPMAPDGKRPLVNHPERFGQRAALQIAPKFPDANLGFWCGSHNRLTVVDIDSPKDSELQWALDTFGPTPIIVRTGSGKHHAYYRHDGEGRHTRRIPGREIDVLGKGPCVAPPSSRPDGRRYEFARGGLSDLAKVPTLRAGALEALLEPAGGQSVPLTRNRGTGTADSSRAVTIGQRNDTLFRLALALAVNADSPSDLLTQLRQANDEICKPPLPDAEARGAARMAWRYKLEGRLMAPGCESSIILPSSALDHDMAAGNFDVMGLLAMARKYHDKPGAIFALAPRALAEADKIHGWSRNRYRAAIRKACEMGALEQITAGGRGPRDPAKYRFAKSKLRGL